MQFSSLTPSVESSWTDLPGGQMSQLDPTPYSYWGFGTTWAASASGPFSSCFRRPGQPDSTSEIQGPYPVTPHFLVYGQAPLSSTMPYRFEIHDLLSLPDSSARVQTTSTPDVESSWTDLPGATSLARVDWGWSQVVNAVPASETLYFRAIVSRPGSPDVLTLPAGPLQVRLALSVDDAGDSLLFIGPDPQPGQTIRVQSSPTPDSEPSWTDVPGGKPAATGAITVNMSDLPSGNQWFPNRRLHSRSGRRTVCRHGPAAIEPTDFYCWRQGHRGSEPDRSWQRE